MRDDGRSPAAGRRGRRATPPDATSGPVGEFAHRLWELKQAAGDPSYARMRSQHGALASRSALAAAAGGRHLPSWDTTWEFVRSLAVGVLDQPEDDTRQLWRDRWDRARLDAGEHLLPDAPAGRPDTHVGRAPATGEGVAITPGAGPGADLDGGAEATPGTRVAARAAGVASSGRAGSAGSGPAGPTGRTPRRWRFLPAVSVALLGGAVIVAAVGGFRTGVPAGPPPPAVPGDAAEFVADVSVPDGTPIRPGDTVVKTWELRNVGSVAWDGRFLHRAESVGTGTVCATLADRVPIARTEPGGTARVSVVVRGLSRTGQCQAFWKMVDDDGRLLLPGARPVYFVVQVVS